MSKIGKLPIVIPGEVKVATDDDCIVVTGPRGKEEFQPGNEVAVKLEDNRIVVTPTAETKRAKQHWGMCRTMIANCITGVTSGFKRELLITGVGYRANIQNGNLQLTLGFSHDVIIKPPDGISITTPSNTKIVVEGNNKQQVGQFAANIRGWRPPEPYKGKGIRYADEMIFRKQGKKK